MFAYLGLGTNLGDRRENLAGAIEGLERQGLRPVAQSSVWETEPLGWDGAGWYWNMTLAVVADRGPFELLDLLLELERRAGRVRTARNAPRTLDVDLLMLGDLTIRDPRLELPHPRMWQRRFVLEPLCEIAPQLCNPVSGRSVAEELEGLRDTSIVRRLGSLASR